MIIGYARVSTQDQNLDWQRDLLKREGCERILEETITGTKMERPELQRLLDMLRPGDVVVVAELTRLSRSTKDLFSLVDKIRMAGANIRSVKESWLDTTTSTGQLLFTIVAGVSQFERDLTVERTKQGLAAARARGRSGGRPRTDEAKMKQAVALYHSKEVSVAEITKATGVKRATLYKYLNEQKALSK